VVFNEEENAHTEEQTEAIEFSDTTNEAQIEEAQTDRAPQDEIHEINDTQGLENTSKKRISDFFSSCSEIAL